MSTTNYRLMVAAAAAAVLAGNVQAKEVTDFVSSLDSLSGQQPALDNLTALRVIALRQHLLLQPDGQQALPLVAAMSKNWGSQGAVFLTAAEVQPVVMATNKNWGRQDAVLDRREATQPVVTAAAKNWGRQGAA